MTSETPQDQPTFKRVMLKISGEALMGDQGYGLHPPTVERIAQEVKSVHDLGVEICMVIGGGNVFRGLQGSAQGMERTTADYMGMLATVMNALAMQSALEGLKIHTRVISAITMNEVAEPYIRRRAVRHLEKKRVCIFAAGTGNPYFTTDTAATLRASEMNCEAIFKGTKVDGVYDKDSFGALDKSMRNPFCARMADYVKKGGIIYIETRIRQQLL